MKTFDLIEYDPLNKVVTFYYNISGYLLPYSKVKKDLGDEAYIPNNTLRAMRVTGISLQDIENGRILH